MEQAKCSVRTQRRDTRLPEPPDGHEKYRVGTRQYECSEFLVLRQSGVRNRENVAQAYALVPGGGQVRSGGRCATSPTQVTGACFIMVWQPVAILFDICRTGWEPIRFYRE